MQRNQGRLAKVPNGMANSQLKIGRGRSDVDKVHGARLVLVLGLLLGLLAGCIGDGDETLRDDPAYGAGYNDGCQTGGTRGSGLPATRNRNDDLWQSSEAYRAGWRAGYNACGPQLGDPLGR